MGINVPGGHEVHVHEATADMHHIVIPPKPKGDLSDVDLEKMAGGAFSAQIFRTSLKNTGSGGPGGETEWSDPIAERRCP